jgi:hypothetical protein
MGAELFLLGADYEVVGDWDSALDSYRRFMPYYGSEIPGRPDALQHARTFIDLATIPKDWTYETLDALLQVIKVAMSTGNARSLSRMRAKVGFLCHGLAPEPGRWQQPGTVRLQCFHGQKPHPVFPRSGPCLQFPGSLPAHLGLDGAHCHLVPVLPQDRLPGRPGGTWPLGMGRHLLRGENAMTTGAAGQPPCCCSSCPCIPAMQPGPLRSVQEGIPELRHHAWPERFQLPMPDGDPQFERFKAAYRTPGGMKWLEAVYARSRPTPRISTAGYGNWACLKNCSSCPS